MRFFLPYFLSICPHPVRVYLSQCCIFLPRVLDKAQASFQIFTRVYLWRSLWIQPTCLPWGQPFRRPPEAWAQVALRPRSYSALGRVTSPSFANPGYLCQLLKIPGHLSPGSLICLLLPSDHNCLFTVCVLIQPSETKPEGVHRINIYINSV